MNGDLIRKAAHAAYEYDRSPDAMTWEELNAAAKSGSDLGHAEHLAWCMGAVGAAVLVILEEVAAQFENGPSMDGATFARSVRGMSNSSLDAREQPERT